MVAVPFTVSEKQLVGFALQVTECAAWIVTKSPATGAPEGNQMAPFVQLPEAMLTLMAEKAGRQKQKWSIEKRTTFFNERCLRWQSKSFMFQFSR